jgi:hypothetical protein
MNSPVDIHGALLWPYAANKGLLGDGTALDRVFRYTAISRENVFPRSGSLTGSHHPQTDRQTEILNAL